jgi:hypothetical protein
MLSGMRLIALSLFVALILGPPFPAAAKVVFRAECGDLTGQRVDMDPNGKHTREDWKPETYRAGPPPEGQGTLKFLSDDTDTSRIRVQWTSEERLLPVVFKSDTQISIADVDDFGVWIYTLYYRAGKVLVTRQTTNPGPGAIGALLTGDCEFKDH